jgi:putative flippase GtrA
VVLGSRFTSGGAHRVLYFNARKAPAPVQFLIYILIGGLSALANISLFLILGKMGVANNISIPTAFALAAVMNYLLCINFLFRHKAINGKRQAR